MTGDELGTEDPLFLFDLFQSDVITAEVDRENGRFVFSPVNSIPSPDRGGPTRTGVAGPSDGYPSNPGSNRKVPSRWTTSPSTSM